MQKQRKGVFFAAVTALVVLAGVWTSAGEVSAAERSLNVETHTKEEIIAYVQSHTGAMEDTITYSQEPVTTAPYSAGILSGATQQYALAALNEVRYIAGIYHEVTADDTYVAQAQTGALINYVNQKMSHTPTQPEGMSDEMYQLGYLGTSRGNIVWSSGMLTLGRSVIHSWMADEDSSNMERVGHRRWCLNPAMGKTGFGAVTGNRGTHGVMYAFDESHTVSVEPTVAWPAQNMPAEYFNYDYPWSISSQTAFSDDVAVKVTRKSDSREWNFSSASADGYFNYNKGGYGQYYCLIFRPSGISGYFSGDEYQVQVSENSAVTLEYTVSFFQLEEIPADTTITLSRTSGSVPVSEDGYYKGVATISISDSGIASDKISVASSDETVAKAMVSESGSNIWLFVKGLKDGMATITVSLSRDVKADFLVTVGTGGEHVHTYDTQFTIDMEAGCETVGSKSRHCTGCGAKTDITVIPAKGHSYGEWMTIKAESCTEAGIKERVCAECGERETEILGAAGHKWDKGVLSTEQTCGGAGVKTYTCTVCGEKRNEAVSAAGHTIVVDGAKAATCTEAGLTQGSHCSVCGAVLEAQKEIPAKGHSYGGWKVTKAAACTEAGMKERGCTLCGVTETEQIPASGHDWDEGVVTEEAKADSDGIRIYTCKNCHETKNEIIPATGTGENPDKPKKPAVPAIGTIVNEAAAKASYKVTSAGTVEYQRPLEKNPVSVTIPASVVLEGTVYQVTSVSDTAFRNIRSLTKVVIGSSVTDIGASAFSGCTKLKSVAIGKNVTSIGAKAFYKCTSLTKLTIPSKVSRIGKQAFYGCKKLKSITIKTKKLTAKKVGSKAFKGIYAKAVVKTPKTKLKSYKKLLMAKGVGRKAKIRK